MKEKYDIAILGGGPGGYVAAIRAAQLGFKTVVVEKDNLGGICLNWGCIPTKALLKSAEVYDLVKNKSKDFGISVGDVSFDFDKIIKRSRRVSAKITKGVEFLFKKNKIEKIKGFGRLISSNEIAVFDGENLIDTVSAEKIIISTGARSRQLPFIPVDRKKIITSTEAMILDKAPEEMIIIGAGAIGVEFAYFYNTFGAKVTIIEMMEHLLPIEDKEVSAVIEKNFKKSGINFITSAAVKSARVSGDKVEVIIENNGEEQKLTADIALNAVGVQPNTENIGLEKAGVQTEKGWIVVDKSTYETNVKNIFAIGDVIGPPWLAHVASAEAVNCVEKIKGLDTTDIDYSSIPGCTYAHPQAASIGLTEEKARAEGYELKIGKFPFSASGKSAAIGERDGFVKIIFDAEYGELLGAHIVGPEATELLAELGIAKTLEADFEAIVKTIHAHPTLSESIMEAAADAYGQAIHI